MTHSKNDSEKFFTQSAQSAQYEQMSLRAAVADISHRAKLAVSGKDCLKFLQSILTNDITKPSEGEGIYSLMLDRKGKILADMIAFRKKSEASLDLESQAAEKIARLMSGLKLSYKVEICSAAPRAIFHIAGPEATGIVSQISGTGGRALKHFDHFETSADGARVWVARVDRTGKTGFDIETAPENSQKITRLLAEKNAPAVPAEIIEIMRVESAMPRYGKDMDESVIATESGLLGAISFDKGCYVGQEIVARTHWRAKLKRGFARFEFKRTPPPEGAAVVSEEGQFIGKITSSVFSPHLGPVAVGYVRREFMRDGTEIKTETGQRGKVAGSHSPPARPDNPMIAKTDGDL